MAVIKREEVMDMLRRYNADDRSKIVLCVALLCDDPDGAWSTLESEGIDISFDDVNTVCEYTNSLNGDKP